MSDWPFVYFYAFPLARGPGALQVRQLLLQGALRVGQLAEARLQGLPENEYDLELRHLRDWAWGLALQSSVRSLLYVDSGWMQPTAHARRFFVGSQVHRLWPAEERSEAGFYGVAGSLAFCLYRDGLTGAGLGAEALLELMLQRFWQREGVSWQSLPAQRLQMLLQRVRARQPWSAMERLLNELYEGAAPLPPEVGHELHRRGLSPQHWERLGLRVLFLEVPGALEEVWALAQEELNASAELRRYYGLPARPAQWLSQLLAFLEEMAIPAGFALVLWAFVVEGLWAAGQVLQEKAEWPWVLYLAEEGLLAHRRRLAERLALVHDALDVLSGFEYLQDGAGAALRHWLEALLPPLLASLHPPQLEAVGSYRLHALLDLDDAQVDTGDLADV